MVPYCFLPKTIVGDKILYSVLSAIIKAILYMLVKVDKLS